MIAAFLTIVEQADLFADWRVRHVCVECEAHVPADELIAHTEGHTMLRPVVDTNPI
jgi:hypothetical protein